MRMGRVSWLIPSGLFREVRQKNLYCHMNQITVTYSDSVPGKSVQRVHVFPSPELLLA